MIIYRLPGKAKLVFIKDELAHPVGGRVCDALHIGRSCIVDATNCEFGLRGCLFFVSAVSRRRFVIDRDTVRIFIKRHDKPKAEEADTSGYV